MLADVAGAMGAFMAFIGDQTGVYKILASHGRRQSDELAELAGVDKRYLREWLSSNAASGYVNYHPEDDTFSMSPEQAEILAQDEHDQKHAAVYPGARRADRDPRSGNRGVSYRAGTPVGRARSRLLLQHRPRISGHVRGKPRAELAAVVGRRPRPSWKAVPRSPTSVAVTARRRCCSPGPFQIPPSTASTSTSPRSRWQTFTHPRLGITNAIFEIANAKEFPGADYDLICVFDALHDMGDPVGASRHVKEALKADGTFMVVEPIAENDLKDNLTTLAGIYYGFSTTVCLPASRSQEVGLCLGAQAGERRLTEVLTAAGFSSVRRTMSTASNMILEARP